MSEFNEQIREKGYALQISDDGLEAVLYLTNLLRYELSIPGLNQLLKDEGVTTGIDRSAVADIVTNQRYNTEVVIANGRNPQDGKDGEFVFHFKRFHNNVPKLLEDGSVDYRDIELFTFVEQGQLLAEYIHATPGVMGFSVRGKLLMPVKGKDRPAIRGTGFVLNSDATEYYAKTAGKIVYRVETDLTDAADSIAYQFMEISPAFVHQGTLLYREGDINFNGDVLIGGDVQAGITICATGDIEIDGSVESAVIKSCGNILIKKGIIGAGKGSIEAQGTIRGKFFESTTLTAVQDIECNYLFNCVVKTDNMIRVKGNKGSIVAGSVSAMMGIEAFTIGNESGVRTDVSVGINRTTALSYKQLEQRIASVSLDINVFQKNNFPENPFYSKIVLALEMKEKELQELQKQQKELMDQIARATKASVTTKGIIYGGVEIQIEDKKMELQQTLRAVRFKKQGEHIAVYHY